MSKVSTKPPSGTRDFLPHDIVRRNYVVRTIEAAYAQYGFVPLETPSFENLTTLLGKYGDEGDQLLFRLLHRRDALKRVLEQEDIAEHDLADLGLRYDLTVPLARVVANYSELPKFFKRYQIQPVWRADRPGHGRFREFYQCDVDAIGTESLVAEAEVCSAVATALQKLGFRDFAIQFNHRELLRGLIQLCQIASAQEQTALIALDKIDKIGPDGVAKELMERGIDETASRRLLTLTTIDDKGSPLHQLEALRATLNNELCQHALDDLMKLFQLLDGTPVRTHIRFNPALARGLSYYTGAIFELTVPDLHGSIGGGGRYDNLIGMFSKQSIPAVGCSLGLERILLVMEERKMYPDLHYGPQIMLCWMPESPISTVLHVAEQLRQQGLRVDVFPEPAKLGKQLQYADAPGIKAPIAAILGESELAQSVVTLKNLTTGEQQQVEWNEVNAFAQKWLIPN